MNCRDNIFDGWGYWLNKPSIIPSILGVDNVYHRNCNEIKRQLCEHNIKASVSRHKLFDNHLFLLDVSDNEFRPHKRDIAKALNIPVEWVELYKCDTDLDVYAVLEDELIDMYGDCHKELHFKDPFDFLDAINNPCSPHSVVKQLNEKQCKKTAKVLISDDGDVVLLKDVHMSDFLVAEALDIPKEAVIDISCESEEFSHIILVDRCKE